MQKRRGLDPFYQGPSNMKIRGEKGRNQLAPIPPVTPCPILEKKTNTIDPLPGYFPGVALPLGVRWCCVEMLCGVDTTACCCNGDPCCCAWAWACA